MNLNPVEETLVELMIGIKLDPLERNIERVYDAIESTGVTCRPAKGSAIGIAELAFVVLCDALMKKEGFVKGSVLN